jgi:hypothetical protein
MPRAGASRPTYDFRLARNLAQLTAVLACIGPAMRRRPDHGAWHDGKARLAV